MHVISQSKRRWRFKISTFQTRTASYKISIPGYYSTYFPVSHAFGLFCSVVIDSLFSAVMTKSITSLPDGGIIIVILKVGENDTEWLGPLSSKTLKHLHNLRHIITCSLVPSYAVLEDLLNWGLLVCPRGSLRRSSLYLGCTLQPPASPCTASEHPHCSARSRANFSPGLGPVSSFVIRI